MFVKNFCRFKIYCEVIVIREAFIQYQQNFWRKKC